MSSSESLQVGTIVRYAVILAVFIAAVVIVTPSSAPAPLPTTSAAHVTSPCDLGSGPCRVDFDGHHGLELSVGPRPIRVLTPLTLEASFKGAADHARVTFTSTTMDMGTHAVPLTRRADGVFAATGVLPICTKDTMQWIAKLEVDLDGETHMAAFGFTTERSRTAPAADSAAAAASNSAATDSAAAVVAAATLMEPAVTVDAALHSVNGPVKVSDFRGKLTLVYFGYATCPDVCPTALAALASGLKQLTSSERAQLQTLFVSVDPERDTLEQLAAYGTFFDPGIIGVSGSATEVKAAAKTFGVAYAKHQEPGSDDYVVDHSSFTAVVDPEGRYVAQLAHAAPAAVVLATVRRFLPAQGKTP